MTVISGSSSGTICQSGYAESQPCTPDKSRLYLKQLLAAMVTWVIMKHAMSVMPFTILVSLAEKSVEISNYPNCHVYSMCRFGGDD